MWANIKLSTFIVKDRAINFILDTDFNHYVPLEMSVEFIV